MMVVVLGYSQTMIESCIRGRTLEEHVWRRLRSWWGGTTGGGSLCGRGRDGGGTTGAGSLAGRGGDEGGLECGGFTIGRKSGNGSGYGFG